MRSTRLLRAALGRALQSNFVHHPSPFLPVRPVLLPVYCSQPNCFQRQIRAIRVGGQGEQKKKTQTIVQEETRQAEQDALQARQSAGSAQQQAQQAAQQPAQPARDYSKEPTAGAILEQDVGLQKFVSRVVMNTAGGLGITALSSALFVTGILPMPMMKAALIVGLIGGLGCLFGAMRIQPVQMRDAQGHLVCSNPPARTAFAAAFCGIQGMMIAPLLAMSPAPLVGAAALVTGGVVAGMGAFALSKPSGSLLKWGGPLFVGVLGLIGCGLGSMFIGGPFGTGLFWMSAIGGIGIFSAFTAYDIQLAIQQYREGFADHMGHALNLYLDVINLFQKILMVMRMFWDE